MILAVLMLAAGGGAAAAVAATAAATATYAAAFATATATAPTAAAPATAAAAQKHAGTYRMWRVHDSCIQVVTLTMNLRKTRRQRLPQPAPRCHMNHLALNKRGP